MMATVGSIADKTGVAALTAGERECLRLVGKLQSSKQIARILGISPHTVDQRMRIATRKLGATNRSEAAMILSEHEALNGPVSSKSPIADRPPERPALPQLAKGERQGETHMLSNSAPHAAYGYAGERGWIERFGLPFPNSGRTRNDLTVLQTMVWLLAISGSAIVLFLLILASLVGLGQLT